MSIIVGLGVYRRPSSCRRRAVVLASALSYPRQTPPPDWPQLQLDWIGLDWIRLVSIGLDWIAPLR